MPPIYMKNCLQINKILFSLNQIKKKTREYSIIRKHSKTAFSYIACGRTIWYNSSGRKLGNT